MIKSQFMKNIEEELELMYKKINNTRQKYKLLKTPEVNPEYATEAQLRDYRTLVGIKELLQKEIEDQSLKFERVYEAIKNPMFDSLKDDDEIPNGIILSIYKLYM